MNSFNHGLYQPIGILQQIKKTIVNNVIKQEVCLEKKDHLKCVDQKNGENYVFMNHVKKI